MQEIGDNQLEQEAARVLTVERGWARSGVKGPLMWGSRSDRLISMIWS